MVKKTFHKYISLAQQLEKAITDGRYQTGDKLPSLRTIKSDHGVSVSTALEAYLYLQDKGLITAKEKSGYFVNHILSQTNLPAPKHKKQKIIKAKTVKRFDIIRDIYLAENENRISFAVVAPGNHMIPQNQLLKIMNKVVNRQHKGLLNYGSITGHAALKKEISKRSIRSGIICSEDAVCITAGCVEAIQIALRAVTKAGDIVAVESPCYYGFLQIIEVLNLRVVEIPSDAGTGMDTVSLKKAIASFDIKSILLSANFSNPTGALMSDESKKELMTIAEQNKIPVIEDDVYGDLSYYGQRPLTIKSFDSNGWCIYCSSFSKSLAPGSRIGWIIPGRFMEIVEKLKYITNMTTAIHPQIVIANFLQEGGYELHLRRLRTQTLQQIHTIQQVVIKHFPEGTKITSPQGGYTLWVELPSKYDASELYLKALKNNVTFLPGKLFTTSKQFDNFLRLSCGNMLTTKHIRALELLGKLVRQDV
ncbi:PLP-dependent aminotransferase family protein [Algoriphagus sp. D3-2-R+10]|uniref:aminotransferase-like domain-containing protein n=1 Tax=Algoriphagus aurantiacus TaxID=3103948 RepID=UPI002B37BD77|nr:PLP-dependent aminotransferase family protein [Algoriphagus sp. D3-2-R+10]MEB2778651.1 PLP-dependent aminotransferase family protein [Algoriphagus sp. D3-2-R+10]